MSDHLVELSGLGKTAGDVVILRDLNLYVDRGEFVVITGASGSGKSTLLNIIGLLDRPTVGRYILRGSEVSKASERERTRLRAQHLSLIFQAFHLVDRKNVLENVELGMTCQGTAVRQRREQAERWVQAVGLSDRRLALPTTLSGGEQQRVAIARALSRSSDLILADEPTGNLDDGNAELVINLLSGTLRGSSSVLMATHDLRLAKRADRVVNLDDATREPTITEVAT